MNKNILVIDDFALVRGLFLRALEDTSYQVDTAELGVKGIKMHQEFKYDLIFLDINMPGMSGIETLRKIRETDSDVPVCIVTALYRDYVQEIKNALDDGIKFLFVHKPITIGQILLIANNILEPSKVLLVK